MDDWPFEDAFQFPDEMWGMIEVGRFPPGPVAHFVRVMWFHFDYENGGLDQVMYNLKQARRERVEDYAQSFEELGLKPLAAVVRLADKHVTVGINWQSVFGRTVDVSSLGLVYHAIAYGQPGAYYNRSSFVSDRFDGLYPTGGDGKPIRIDWVARAALRYARENRTAFERFVQEFRGAPPEGTVSEKE